MDQYLMEQYDVHEDINYLTQESDIKNYFSDGDAKSWFDCGQGYYQDEHELICKINDKFYSVTIYADIGSAKQDIGERLYWVEDITKVKWEEIEKPQPKHKRVHEYKLELTLDEYKSLRNFLKDNNISILYSSFPVNEEDLFKNDN